MLHLVYVTLTAVLISPGTGTYCGVLEIFDVFLLVLAYLLMTKKSLKISFKQCCGTGSVFRSFMDPYSEFRSGPIHVKIGYNRDKWCKI